MVKEQFLFFLISKLNNLFSLNKDDNQRPKYKKLLEHPFVQKAKDPKQSENTAVYLSEIIDGLAENTDTFEQYYYLPSSNTR